MSSNLLKSVKKGELLPLRDDVLTHMRPRVWTLQEVTEGGRILLYSNEKGFLEVGEEHIDWEEYRNNKADRK